MRIRLWIAALGIAAGCATAPPVPPAASTEEEQAKLDAAHRQGQADYQHAKATDDSKKPK